MKLLALSCLASAVWAEMPKCAQIPKGATRRYNTPKTIESGENNPAAISFILENRPTLMKLFAAGPQATLREDLNNYMWHLHTFAGATDDYMMGQYFQQLRQELLTAVREGEIHAHQISPEFAKLYRDNTQRSVRVLKDIVVNKNLLTMINAGEPYFDELNQIAMMDKTEGAKVYQHFVATHAADFDPMTKGIAEVALVKMRQFIDNSIMKVLMDEKVKGKYRQLVSELPLVYQFFNDNIDYIEINNVDKSMEEAIAADILTTLAEQAGDTQIVSMINRNIKFIKKLMTDRALHQQKEKAVGKVMEKNKMLREAAWNEAEYARLLAEAEESNAEVSDAMKKNIWVQVKENYQVWQSEQVGNQMSLDEQKKKRERSLTKYERCVGIIGLMPDELLETIALMVQESCPELDMMDIESEAMKKIFEDQPDNFTDQLMKELHDVCDMFGLIAEDKIMSKMVDGVEVQFVANDWAEGPVRDW